MSKNNHDIRANTLQRVDKLEEWAGSTDDKIKDLAGYSTKSRALLDDLQRRVRSLEAQVAHLENQLAAHKMDTPLARAKRLWRK